LHGSVDRRTVDSMGRTRPGEAAPAAPDHAPQAKVEPAATGTLAHISRSVESLDSRRLETRAILALQNTSGNAAVTQLLRARARLDRKAKDDPLATEQDIKQLKAIAVTPLTICIADLTTVDPTTGDVAPDTVVRVESKLRAIGAGIAVIAHSKDDPAQRDRYYEAVDAIRDALTTLEVRSKPYREKSQVWVDALTRALKGLDRVIALPVLKPGATPDYRLELVDMPLSQRDHDLLVLSVRPQLDALLKRAKAPDFRPQEAADDDTVASALTAVDHRGLLTVRGHVHKAQHAMRVFGMPTLTAMREAAVRSLEDAQLKLSSIMRSTPQAGVSGAAQPGAPPIAPLP
jgi:hypothetical protein